MEYSEIMDKLQEMGSRYNVGFSSLDKTFIDNLYYRIFFKNVSNHGCSNCYRDAYVEILVKLKKDKKMKPTPNYKLKSGAIIQFFGDSMVYANPNLTDEIAEKYLALNSNNSVMFSELPSDWRQRVELYKDRVLKEEKENGKIDKDSLIKGLKSENEKLKKELEEAKGRIAMLEANASSENTLNKNVVAKTTVKSNKGKTEKSHN